MAQHIVVPFNTGCVNTHQTCVAGCQTVSNCANPHLVNIEVQDQDTRELELLQRHRRSHCDVVEDAETLAPASQSRQERRDRF